MNRRQTSWTGERKKKFLRELARTGNTTTAARLVGASRARAYDLRKSDKKFARLWKSALVEAADNLEQEAWRRAVEGWDEPVFHKGEECGIIRKYSDSLLTLLLKHTKRSKYMDRSEVAVNAKVRVGKLRAEDMPDDDLAAIAAGKAG